MTGRRAILHVGAPRTGTTTFQTLLDRHRTGLAAVGVLYPTLEPAAAAHRHINHQHLGKALDGRRPAAERHDLLDALARALETTTADVVILSYERLCLVPRWRRAPARLAALFERHGFTPEVLSTVRPQAGAVQSQYAWRCQFLREARSLQGSFHGDLRNRLLDPSASFGPWLSACGGRATAVPLRDASSPEPLATRIVDALGLGDRFRPLLTPSDLAQAENGSLDAATVEVSRRLRRDSVAVRDNGAARRVVDAIEDEVRRRGLAGTRFQGLDAAMVERAEAEFASANDRFARRIWGQPWQARVSPDRAGPITEIAAGVAALPAEVETALIEIATAVRARCGLQERRGMFWRGWRR